MSSVTGTRAYTRFASFASHAVQGSVQTRHVQHVALPDRSPLRRPTLDRQTEKDKEQETKKQETETETETGRRRRRQETRDKRQERREGDVLNIFESDNGVPQTRASCCAQKPSPRRRRDGSSNENCKKLDCGAATSTLPRHGRIKKELATDEHASSSSSGVPLAPLAPVYAFAASYYVSYDTVSPRTHRRILNFLANFTIADTVPLATTLCPTNVPASCHECVCGESRIVVGSQSHSSWMPCVFLCDRRIPCRKAL